MDKRSETKESAEHEGTESRLTCQDLVEKMKGEKKRKTKKQKKPREKKKHRGTPLTEEEMRQTFSARNCDLLEWTPGVTSRQKIQCQTCSHIWNPIYNCFVYDQEPCPKCAGTLPYSEEEMREIFKKGYFHLLLYKKGANSDQQIECMKCGKKKSMRLSSFLYLGYRCAKCSGKEAYTEEYMRDYFKQEKYTLRKYTPGSHSYQEVTHDVCGHEYTVPFKEFKCGGTRCPECARLRSEKLCKTYFEEWFIDGKQDYKFTKQRPKFLQGLELDGFHEPSKFAFEYNGEQHYRYIPYYHKTMDGFLKQQERDKLKYSLCKENNIKLCIIPYTYDCYKPTELRTFIRAWLQENDTLEIPILKSY